MEINIINEYAFTFLYKSEFEKILKRTLKILNKEDIYAISCIFVDDEKIHEINKKYRNIDRSTDVISFALLDDTSFLLPEMEEIELGDIFISVDTCKRQAEEYEHSFKREICFLFTHGILHLFGYDHMNSEDEKEMIRLQKEILDEIDLV
ncbi:putative rRNA maturation factor [Breznakia sp. PF5-3]|uniref:rRNA maturation RNase YbeY n=1 Tax=unclassified Breznakia TaxID=2623764 RepID=UPI0024064FD6|nr:MULTISPECIES: rRNA maturation RNase YbeY [unclassified Breznakia]MDF9824426.1 putative rRNA maturation factor [Breznakia sp. PM6-1]MDF9835155.1 putative rRNA maturation factor [Breznakia sp. PF5-3]MDF9838320.1 putative rRNA maturation factor [Breznakia sp. PFB2-8]MDF9860336.1 putative rRNA maturation factor [Breznakia sp. PH5-24]